MRTGRRRAIVAFLLPVVLFSLGPWLAAAKGELHEDPENAEVVYSSLALFQYYSTTQDHMLRGDVAEVSRRLARMPFANVPDLLEVPISQLNGAELQLAGILASARTKLEELNDLVAGFRLGEAVAAAEAINSDLRTGDRAVNRIEASVREIGVLLKVDIQNPNDSVTAAFNTLMRKVEDKRTSLGTHTSIFLDAITLIRRMGTVEQQRRAEAIHRERGFEPPPGPSVERPLPTEITLRLDRTEALVGTPVQFRGTLTSLGQALAGRSVAVLLNGVQRAEAVTRPDGEFEGTLVLPFDYIRDLDVEALYQPRREDVGRYLASRSAPVRLTAIFYRATLALEVPEQAYPGRRATIAGRLSYDPSVPPVTRPVEIYLDDSLLGSSSTSRAFSEDVPVGANVPPGRHTLTVLAPALGIYAPALASKSLNVARAQMAISWDMPRIVLTPGQVNVAGQISSDLGPASEAAVTLRWDGDVFRTRTSADGKFEVELSRRMRLELIGSQRISVEAQPGEPWHDSARSSRTTFIINWLSGSGTILLLAVLGLVTTRRVRVLQVSRLAMRFRMPLRRRRGAVRPPRPTPVPADGALAAAEDSSAKTAEPFPAYQEGGDSLLRDIWNAARALLGRLLRSLRGRMRRAAPSAASSTTPALGRSAEAQPRVTMAAQPEPAETEPRGRIIAWYRRIAQLLGDVIRIVILPNQTLREFLAEVAPKLGPLAGFFSELTYQAERLLYSRWQPTAEAATRADQISRQIETQIKASP